MRKIGISLLGLIGGLSLILVGSCRPTDLVLYAQALPYTVTVTWTPNAAADNVVNYQVQLDAGAPATVVASSCTPTACMASVPIPAYGSHTMVVWGQNYILSTSTTLQAGSKTTVPFVLNQVPGTVQNVGLK